MRRRRLLAGGLAALAAPSIGRAQGASTLKFIPQVDLATLDPQITTAYITRAHGYMVFDTLYRQDGAYAISPQMLDGHVVGDDGKLWTLTLRPGLVWHDGSPVLARDCTASIRRWAKRDPFGGALMAATDEHSAVDDRTIRFRLNKPFPMLPAALGKLTTPVPVMMPERLANTDPFKPVSEMIGSGPFRFLADQRIPGARNVYQKFEGYRPRAGGTPDRTAGPKIVHFDRVEWTTIPDDGTKAAALQAGEQDWWFNPSPDLLPLLRRNRGIKVETTATVGFVNMLRPNHLQPPFDNPAIRRAMFGAIDQETFMQAVVGDDTSLYHTPCGFFCPGTPMASEAGLDPLRGPRNSAKVKEELKRAGYNGEKVVLLAATDYTQYKVIADVAADMMTRAGMNVDYVSSDMGSIVQRRVSKSPVDKGGWSCFVTGGEGEDHINPSNDYWIRGNGNDTSAFPGWCVSPQLEALRDAWFDAPGADAQKKVCEAMQLQCMQDVPSLPLGQNFQPTAYRNRLTGILNGFALFWNVRPG